MTFRSLICEEHPNKDGELQSYVSVGRVSFWILLSYMSYYWMILKIAPPDTLWYSWIIMVVYNLAKKIFNIILEKFTLQLIPRSN